MDQGIRLEEALAHMENGGEHLKTYTEPNIFDIFQQNRPNDDERKLDPLAMVMIENE